MPNLKLQLRRDTRANWATNGPSGPSGPSGPTPPSGPVLALGEPGIETDTLLLKFGDGQTPWNSLPYSGLTAYTPSAASNWPIGPSGPSGPTTCANALDLIAAYLVATGGSWP